MVLIVMLFTGCTGLGGTWSGSYGEVEFELEISEGLMNLYTADVTFDWAGGTYSETQEGLFEDGRIDLGGSAPKDGEISMAMNYHFDMTVDGDTMTGMCVAQGQADFETFIDTGGYDCALHR